MSKLSQIHAELEERATELGYESLIKALEDGWVPDYEQRTLHKPVDLQEQAHADWLRERDLILKNLNELYDELVYLGMDEEYLETINDTIEFIKKGEA